jgi:hypothetical protein
LSLAVDAAAPAIGSAFSVLRRGPDALLAWMKARDQRRYEEFCRAAYDGEVEPDNAEDLTAEELLTMLRACLADLEDEKAVLYGRLASAIAHGRVVKPYRYPLMASLTAMTHAQATRLRKGLIAGKHHLIPHMGAGRRSQNDFLGGDGLVDMWDADKLASLSMVKEGNITKLAHHLVLSCFSEAELEPESIGERAWVSEFAVDMITYEMGTPSIGNLVSHLDRVSRELGLKLAPLAQVFDQRRAQMFMGRMPCLLILVAEESGRLLEHAAVVRSIIGRRYTPVIATQTTPTSALVEAFPDAKWVEGTEPDMTFAQRVMDTVADVLIAAKSVGGASGQ